MITDISENQVTIKKDETINMRKTLDCGQSFRWKYDAENNIQSGIIGNNSFTLIEDDKIITIKNDNYSQHPLSQEEFAKLVNTYFDLERDYKSINEYLYNDKILSPAIDYSLGIRILKQDIFEMIISFIISQNNNIPRIKKIINTLCNNFGDEIICDNGDIKYTFPGVEKLSELEFSELDILKSGFRQKYIFDAVSKISSGIINIDDMTLMDYDGAKEELIKIKGVGEKVANCILLFGFNKINAFPVDVWIKRILDQLYHDSDINEVINFYSDYAGIAQQYLFYYSRDNLGK